MDSLHNSILYSENAILENRVPTVSPIEKCHQSASIATSLPSSECRKEVELEMSRSSCEDSGRSSLDGIEGTLPDPDAIKMFVGQIPRSMDEGELQSMFEEFGPVHQINVLRDKTSGQSKGCCFVTFYSRKSALNAQNALHNIKTLDGMHHPIQMKPADTENRNERKLFIGMLSKKYDEEDVRNMFTSFGSIEECTVLRDSNNISKGCAFVTFSNRQNAIVSIKAMHHSCTMEGCSSPLVVKFADTQKDKVQKKVEQLHTNYWTLASSPTSSSQLINSQCIAQLQAVQTMQQSGPNLQSLQSLQQQQQQQLLTSNLFHGPGLSSLGGLLGLGVQAQANQIQRYNYANQYLALASAAAAAANAETNGLLNYSSLCAINESTSLHNYIPSSAALTIIPNQTNFPAFGLTNINSYSSLTSTNDLPSISTLLSQGQQGLSSSNHIGSPLIMEGDLLGSPDSSTSNIEIQRQKNFNYNFSTSSDILPILTESSKQHEGPEGANLFIYHLPQEFTDNDLLQNFTSFGNIISAKVFIDKQTNLSKCFGFVSYDNSISANAAIQGMNGFTVGTKRLKVQLKRSKNGYKPY